VFHLPHCGRIPAFMVTAYLRETLGRRLPCFFEPKRKSTVMKIVIVVGTTLAVVTAASAADIPRPQPVYQTAQVGKMPIGKTPVGKTPIGKPPVARRAY